MRKKMLKGMVHTFFVVYFLISMLLAVRNLLGVGNMTMDEYIFFKVFLYALVGAIPSFLTCYKKEPTFKQVIIRRFLQLGLIICGVLIIGFGIGAMEKTNCFLYIGLITLVYLLEFVITSIFNLLEAQEITNEIQDFKKRHRS